MGSLRSKFSHLFFSSVKSLTVCRSSRLSSNRFFCLRIGPNWTSSNLLFLRHFFVCASFFWCLFSFVCVHPICNLSPMAWGWSSLSHDPVKWSFWYMQLTSLYWMLPGETASTCQNFIVPGTVLHVFVKADFCTVLFTCLRTRLSQNPCWPRYHTLPKPFNLLSSFVCLKFHQVSLYHGELQRNSKLLLKIQPERSLLTTSKNSFSVDTSW